MKNNQKVKSVFKIILYSLFLLSIIFVSLVLLYINNTIQSVKNVDINLNDENIIKTSIFDNKNIDISDDMYINKISLNDINDHTKNAFISIEDKDFYKHKGLNYKRIVKATFNNLKSMSFKEGASTITQQLVKNRYLTNEKTIDRKIKEAYLSLKLEKKENKDKIFETYLNTIYFGNGAYGIYDASKLFFNKEPKDLSLSESCVLAGAIKAPSLYSPINNYENSIKRKKLILGEMLEDGFITTDEYNKEINEEVKLSNESDLDNNNIDLYNEFVIDEACKILNVKIDNILNNGYKIYTYKDTNIQNVLDEKINDKDNYHINTHGNVADSLAIIIDNKNYTVSAVSGKSKYSLVNIKRQPGSLIKPIFTFAPALEEKEIYLSSEILDEEINIDNYSPKNVGNKYYGYVSVRDAVAKSLNVPTVKLTEAVGLDKCKSYAEMCGIEFSEKDTGYAMSLGGMTDGVTLKDITDSYSVFTSGGNYIKSNFIKEIKDKNGKVIYEHKLSQNKVYNEDTVYLITNTLEYAVKNGTSKKLSKLPFAVAGKTGTVSVKDTNLNTDAYSLAYTKDHTMCVWFGNYTMKDEYNLDGSNNGGTYASKVILDTFSDMYKEKHPANFDVPDTIIDEVIDGKTLSDDHVVVLGSNVPERYQIKEIFSSSNTPKSKSTKFSKIDKFDFDINKHKNSITISFNTFDYISYKIYRLEEGKTKCLKTINNHDGLYEYIDLDILPNISYGYYIVASSKYSNDTYTTDTKIIKLEKKYNDLLKNNNTSYDWLFA